MHPRRGFGAGAWGFLVLMLCSTLLALAYERAGSTVATLGATSLEKRYHPPGARPGCLGCHPSAAPPVQESALSAPLRQDSQAYALPPEAELTHWWLGCNHCHTLHGGTTNLHLISEVIQTDYLPPAYAVKTGPRDVVFLSLQGPNSYADGDAVYDGVCQVCHTETKYHRGDPSGDHTHFPGAACSNCHDHSDYFQPTGITDHPQAVTDCSNCHLGPTGEPDLLGVHDYNCEACHPGGFDGTILGLLGVWQGECTECHNPSVPETHNLETPTKGHRCVVCHGSQLPTSSPREMHKDHLGEANCVVCHGFIPDVGTEIGSGNREICSVCHRPGRRDGVRHRRFHRKHATKGASCLECHAGERPPVDVVDGPPVGGSTNVCQVCHRNRSPSDFWKDMDKLHKRHVGESIDCGFCHKQAELQDDRDPMPGHDDPVRATLDRAWYNECRFCHGSDEFDSSPKVHKKHVPDQWQWCYNCHEASDPRPLGLKPPVTEPAKSCLLCHDDEGYDAQYPFSVHRKHSDMDVKCYACHQLTPWLFDWPKTWMVPD